MTYCISISIGGDLILTRSPNCIINNFWTCLKTCLIMCCNVMDVESCMEFAFKLASDQNNYTGDWRESANTARGKAKYCTLS